MTGPVGAPSPHGHWRRSRQELLTACDHGARGTQGSGAVPGTVSWAGVSSVLPSGRAVMFSTGLFSTGTATASVLHMPCVGPVLLLEY